MPEKDVQKEVFKSVDVSVEKREAKLRTDVPDEYLKDRLGDLNERAVSLRKSLKNAIEKPAKDNEINDEEWMEIFNNLLKENAQTLNYFDIKDIFDLKAFVGIKIELSREKKGAIVKEISDDEGESSKVNFFSKTIKLLSPQDVADVVYQLVIGEKLTFNEVLNSRFFWNTDILEIISGSSSCKLIMMLLAQQDGKRAITGYSEYKKKIPEAFDVLKIGVRSCPAAEDPQGFVKGQLLDQDYISQDEYEELIRESKKIIDLREKVLEIKKQLKKQSIANDDLSDDDWKLIFRSLIGSSPELLDFFQIQDGTGLQLMMRESQRPKISKSKKDAIIFGVLHDKDGNGRDYFFENVVSTLHSEDVADIVYTLVCSQKLNFYDLVDPYLEDGKSLADKIQNSPQFKLITKVAAMNGTGAIDRYPEYKNKFADPFDILMLGVHFCAQPEYVERKIKELVKDGLLSQDEQKDLNEELFKKKRAREIFRKAIGNVPVESLNIQSLANDPALEHLEDMNPDWIKNSQIDPKELPSIIIAVVRNLFFKNIELTEQSVQQEVERILSMKKQYDNVPLFKERNVLYAAHLQLKPSKYVQSGKDDEWSFGKKATREAIQKQGAKLDFKRPEAETVEGLLKAKNEVLKSIENTPPPFTFIFDGHGGPDALYFSQGQVETLKYDVDAADSIKITVGEFAASYKKRYEKFPELLNPEAGKNDILIFSACYNHNFVRTLYSLLPPKAQKPVTIGQSEYGQYGYGDIISIYGASFFEHTLGLSNGGTSTFHDVFLGDKKQNIANPYCYIPGLEPEEIMQISQKETPTGDEKAV